MDGAAARIRPAPQARQRERSEQLQPLLACEARLTARNCRKEARVRSAQVRVFAWWRVCAHRSRGSPDVSIFIETFNRIPVKVPDFHDQATLIGNDGPGGIGFIGKHPACTLPGI
jgi:hypothetical protein